jgi:2-polyprenyl-3-methyl-5-hydroxy-6-metoxy-1,4-benzoquinol methylase
MGKNLDVNIATKSSNDMNRSNFGSGSDVQKMYSDDALYPGYMMRLLEDQNTLRKKYYTKLARKFAFNRASSWDFMKNRYKGFWPKTDAKIRILDVGSGTGEHTLQFAIGFPNAEVVGIDLSPGSVAAADRLKEHFGVNNVTFIKMDLIEDDLSRLGKFDLINCSGVLHHTESPEKSLQNIQQCMIPDKSVIWIFLYSNWLRHKEKSIRESLRIIFPNDDSLAERVQFCKNIGMTRGSIYYHASLQHRIINNFKKIRNHSVPVLQSLCLPSTRNRLIRRLCSPDCTFF